VLTVQADVIKPEYFPDSYQLFPRWPLFDSERMVRLFGFTLAILLLPKAIGLVLALVSPSRRRAMGGVSRLVPSAVVELVLTALYAPVMMAIHTAHVVDVLAGRDGGWKIQRRGGSTTLGEAWSRHWLHTALGVASTVAAWFVAPSLLLWLS